MRRARWARVGVKASERPGARAGPSLQVPIGPPAAVHWPSTQSDAACEGPVRARNGSAAPGGVGWRWVASGGLQWRWVASGGVGWRRVALGGVGLHWVASSGVGCRRRAREREEPKVGIGLP